MSVESLADVLLFGFPPAALFSRNAQPTLRRSFKLISLHSVTYQFTKYLTPFPFPLRIPFLSTICPSTEKECLATCVQNMQQSDDLSPLEIVEMFAGLSCFLKDSSDVSQTLLDDFRMCQGYAFLCDLMLRYN